MPFFAISRIHQSGFIIASSFPPIYRGFELKCEIHRLAANSWLAGQNTTQAKAEGKGPAKA
jgi:hypothetical protein